MSLASQVLALATRIATEITNNKAIAANASNLTSGTVPDGRLPASLRAVSKQITDWNTAVENGWYKGDAAATNGPSAAYYIGEVVVWDNDDLTQTVHDWGGSSADTKSYRRRCVGGVWGAWYKLSLAQGEQDVRYAPKILYNGGTTKESRNVLSFESGSPNVAGDLVILTTIPFNYHMCKVTLRGYSYSGGDANIDLDVGFYAYQTSGVYSFPNTGAVNRGDFPVKSVRLARHNASGAVAIIVKSGLASEYWQYPKIVVDAIIGHSTPPDSLFTGWSATFATDLTAYTILDTPALVNYEPAIAAGAAGQYWRGDKTWQTLDKASVGLPNADNTSDANKPVSTAQQTALNAKAPLASPAFTTSATLDGVALVKSNDSRLADSRAPSGAAGGGLGGSYPNPTVVKVAVPDTRSVDDLPQSGASQVSWAFKQSSVVGIPDASTFCLVQYMRAYPDTTAGLPQQIAYTDLGNTYRRQATGMTNNVWGSWVKIADASQANVFTNDSRLSDARIPTAHTHVATTDLTATGTKDSTTFLRGDNTWAAPPSGSTTPAGSVTMYAGSSAPSGYLLCDGLAYSRSTYAALFAVIGTAYGAGDGTNTFNVPDMRDRFPVGVGTGHALGTSDGVAAGSSRNALHDMSHGHGSSGSSSNDSAGTPSGTIPALTAGTPTGTTVNESAHVHDMSHTHFDSFALSKTSGNRNSGTAISTIDTVTLSGGVTTNSRNTGAGSPHNHTFTGDPLPTHQHTFNGTALPGHGHTIFTSVSNNTVTRLPRLGFNFIIKT